MSYRTTHISSSKEHPYLLTIEERSRFRDGVALGVDHLCAFTGHRVICGTTLGTKFFDKVWNWAEASSKDIYSVDIDRAGISALSNDPDDWWPGDPDEDD
jgi:hypothetical protein